MIYFNDRNPRKKKSLYLNFLFSPLCVVINFNKKKEMELERAVHVIEAIPYISKQIIDDTLYEKVLSFLIMVLTHEPKAIQTFQRKDIFQHIKKVSTNKTLELTEQKNVRHV